MKSIRFYLIFTLFAAMTLLIFISALHSYRYSAQRAELLLDKQLIDMAHVLTMPGIAAMNPVENKPVLTTNTAFQIWQGDQLRQHSLNAPKQPMTLLNPGFRDSNFNQYRWRNYVHQDKTSDRWIIIAERRDNRSRLVDDLILASVLPTLYILPIALIIIWLIVGYGLQPIRKLADLLAQKHTHDFDTITLDNPLQELQPLVESTNTLLTRLRKAFEREMRFSADAAHELRTPISVLKVHLHNLQSESPTNSPHLQQLSSGVDRMSHLIEQILTFYRSAPDQYIANFQPLDLYQLVQSSIAQQYPNIETKTQHIELIGTSAWLNGDQFALETLFQNLLSNANKYTPENGCIEVSIHSSERLIELKIEDSGSGIPKAQFNRVFDRFYRLHGDQHASGAIGCGLGLSIVQHIVQLHDATIRLEASKFTTGKSKGLAVVVVFPACRS